MAVYRSDQAQLTFSAEAAPGASPELNSPAAGATAVSTNQFVSHLAADAPAGQRFITCAANTNAETGQFIKIGPGVTNATTFLADSNSEVRRIEAVEGNTIYLDIPLAFKHLGASGDWAAGTQDIVIEVSAIADAAADTVITQIPGIYETVDTPDPEMAIEPRYFLGTQSKRSFFTALKGQQTYTGSLSGIIPVNAAPFRFPIGSMVDVPATAANYSTSDVLLRGDHYKGDMWITVDVASGTQAIAVGDTIYFADAGTTTINTNPGAAVEKETAVLATGVSPVAAANAGGSKVRLTTPLRYDHADNEAILKVSTTPNTVAIAHHIFEQIELDSVSWHVHMRDSGETAANDFDRRYYGGKIGATTISAEEGGMLTMGWDGVNFLGMTHNQKLGINFDTGGSSAEVDIPFYSLMQSIDGTTLSQKSSFPTNDPFFFSQGEVKIFGETMARVRNFSLSIANNEEPRYYVSRQLGRHRGPTKIEEQRREYGLAVTLGLPDSGDANAARKTLWSELLLEGDYGAGMRGFNVELTFNRGGGATSASDDTITIRIPNDYSGVQDAAGNWTGAQTGGNQQGAFIRTAPHSITTDNPFQVEADIFFRNMSFVVQDKKGDYS
tara:strand:- start:2406 stop:4241 length:1836 start_codon:yes stop_codon:yes gene_type:complete